MPFIHVVPDRSYTVEQVSQRFELPSYVLMHPRFPQILEAAARLEVRRAVDANKLRGWHWRSDMGVEIDESELQVDLDALSRGEPIAPDSGTLLTSQDKVAYVIKMWYQVPVIHTEEIIYESDAEARMDGFVKDIHDFEEV